MAPSSEDSVARLWVTWRGLTGEFGFWRLMGHLSKSPTGYSLYGVDLISTLRETPMARGAFARMANETNDTLERLTDMAGVNLSRHQSMWRMAAMFYVSVPVTLFLAGLEGAPDLVRDVLATAGVGIAVVVALLTLWILVYFVLQWRAQLIVAVLDLIRIERLARPPVASPPPKRRGAGR